MSLWEEVTQLIGLVTKETGGKLWSRGSIWEIKGERQFLCNQCSKKALNYMEDHFHLFFPLGKILTQEEEEKLLEKIETDGITLPPVPEKYKDSLYAEELDWTYRVRPDAVIICEECRETII